MSERPEEEPEHRSEDELTEEDLTGDNLERRFAELVRGLETPSWPDEDSDDERDRAVEAAKPPRTPPEEPTLLELWDAELPEDPTEPEETYSPPPPPPVPRPSRPAVLGLILIAAGIVLFVKPTLIGTTSDLGILLGAAVVLTGVGVLIWRLRPGGEDDPYDPDDGAVV